MTDRYSCCNGSWAEGHTDQCQVADLLFKVQYLVDYIDSLTPLEDGLFSFPDGDYWAASRGKLGA